MPVNARRSRSLLLILGCIGFLSLVSPVEADAYEHGASSVAVNEQQVSPNAATVDANAQDNSGSGTPQSHSRGSSDGGSPPQLPSRLTRDIQCTTPTSSGYSHGAGSGVPECYFAPQNAVTPQNSAPPANWRQQLQRVIDQVEKQMQLHAGTIGADPSPNRALVNLPQCYWLDGASDPNLSVTLKLAGQPGPDGQRAQFEFVVAAGRTGVNWSFGDGDDSQTSVPIECSGHDGTAAHQYTAISTPGRPYEVTASEVFAITVTEYWQDSYGPHSEPLDLGLAPAVVSPPAIATTVGQEEGVPLSPGAQATSLGG